MVVLVGRVRIGTTDRVPGGKGRVRQGEGLARQVARAGAEVGGQRLRLCSALLTSCCSWPGGGKEESLNVNEKEEEEAQGEARRPHMPQGRHPGSGPCE